MVYLSTSDEWQRQSALLLQARPSTTRITTKYKIPNLSSPKYQTSRKRKREVDVGSEEKEDANAPKIPRAVLVLKTYDHESGACLKFKTDRAAEVGRMIGSLGRLGRHMAALPEQTQDVVMENSATQVSDARETAPTPSESKPQVQSSGGGGTNKKKKKGKK